MFFLSSEIKTGKFKAKTKVKWKIADFILNWKGDWTKSTTKNKMKEVNIFYLIIQYTKATRDHKSWALFYAQKQLPISK